MEMAQSLRPLKTIYWKACKNVGVKTCGVIQISQENEPDYYISLDPTWSKSMGRRSSQVWLWFGADAHEARRPLPREPFDLEDFE